MQGGCLKEHNGAKRHGDALEVGMAGATNLLSLPGGMLRRARILRSTSLSRFCITLHCSIKPNKIDYVQPSKHRQACQVFIADTTNAVENPCA